MARKERLRKNQALQKLLSKPREKEQQPQQQQPQPQQQEQEQQPVEQRGDAGLQQQLPQPQLAQEQPKSRHLATQAVRQQQGQGQQQQHLSHPGTGPEEDTSNVHPRPLLPPPPTDNTLPPHLEGQAAPNPTKGGGHSAGADRGEISQGVGASRRGRDGGEREDKLLVQGGRSSSRPHGDVGPKGASRNGGRDDGASGGSSSKERGAREQRGEESRRGWRLNKGEQEGRYGAVGRGSHRESSRDGKTHRCVCE
jgi:hypothetical protein